MTHKTPLLFERGTGSALRSGSYTKAARRAIEDALWHHSINVAEVFGADKSDMMIDVEIACQEPAQVEQVDLYSIFPYGQINITTVAGGLDAPHPKDVNQRRTIIAHAAITVSLALSPKEGAV